MDWHKVKNIIIFVLLILDIGLFSVYYKTNAQDMLISEETKDKVVALLAQNNISLDKKIIPSSPGYFSGCYIERAVRTNSSFVTRLMGKDYKYSEATGEYTAGNKKLLIKNGIFDYSDSSPANPPKESDEKYLKEYCVNEMKILGIDEDLYNFSSFNYTDDAVIAVYSPKLGKYDIFDSYISFEISSRGISKISGKNIVIEKSAPGISSRAFGINSVLLSLPSNKLIDSSRLNKIISIKAGYYIGDSEENYSSMLAIPVWQIATENGVILYYDARDGKEIL